MLKKDLIMKNPLRVLEPDAGTNTDPYRMGLILARAGVGKTALLVQIALDSMLRGNCVVHVSIGHNLDKNKAWYEDVFKNLSRDFQLEKAAEVYEECMRRRMIMTFNATTFTGPKLEERLNDLVYQNIFKPECLVLDGFDFKGAARQDLEKIQELAETMSLHVWFSALRAPRDSEASPTGIPAPYHAMEDLFDTIVLLQPEGNGIALNIVKNKNRVKKENQVLHLDPSTFLVRQS